MARQTAYGDSEGDQAHRYARTKEFIQIVRKLWTEENVTYHGEHFSVTDSTVVPRAVVLGERKHPRLYLGGASEAAEKVAATKADVQLCYTAPGKFGGGGAGTTSGLAGRSAEDVAKSLRNYQALGITHFVLSDTPYLPEIKRQGDQLLPLLRV